MSSILLSLKQRKLGYRWQFANSFRILIFLTRNVAKFYNYLKIKDLYKVTYYVFLNLGLNLVIELQANFKWSGDDIFYPLQD